jgi:hypothetical protein
LVRAAASNIPIPITLAACSITKDPVQLDGAPLNEDLLVPVLDFINVFHLELLAVWNGILDAKEFIERVKKHHIND